MTSKPQNQTGKSERRCLSSAPASACLRPYFGDHHTHADDSGELLSLLAGLPLVGEGALVGTSSPQAEPDVLEIGEDCLLGLSRDEMEVEYLRLYPLQRHHAGGRSDLTREGGQA